MEYTARWGSKGFIVSSSKIVPLLNLSTSFSVKSESGDDTSGTATTNVRGRELQSVSLSTLYVRGAGVDPRAQIDAWEALVGTANPLYIEGVRFGPSKLMLKSVDVSDILMTNKGKFLQCAISLKFEEYSDGKETSKTASMQAGNATAMNATASPSDKAAKKSRAKVVSVE